MNIGDKIHQDAHEKAQIVMTQRKRHWTDDLFFFVFDPEYNNIDDEAHIERLVIRYYILNPLESPKEV